MNALRAACVFFLFSASALASEPFVGIRQGSGSWSGTVIHRGTDGSGLVLTCAHRFEKHTPVEVLVSRTSLLRGRFVAFDDQRDLALIAVERLPDVRPAGIAIDSPHVGRELKICGFGKGEYVERKTRVVTIQDVTYDRRTARRAIRFDAETRPGDSGAGLIADRKLRGVNVAHGGQDGFAIPVETVRDFLHEKCRWRFPPQEEAEDRRRRESESEEE